MSNTSIPTAPASENMQFKMHPDLLWDVITRQAGSLGKAMLEGVMNSIDAGATKIDLTLKTTGFELVDDGRGFGSREDVSNFFATFGMPHKAGDARFGRFRMGRGQMFSFASTVWRSNCNEMVVDIKTMGLDFIYRSIPEGLNGCRITGKFYRPLAPREIVAVRDEVLRNCKYLEIPLFINGEAINTSPETVKWETATDEFYCSLRSGGTAGISIYQQGVYVETIPAYEFGLSGTVVTKAGFPLKVNFARNQVMRDCRLFSSILKMVGVESKKKVSKRRDLDDSERDMLIASLVDKSAPLHEIKGAKIFQDVTGRWWSSRQLVALFKGGKLRTLPDGRRAFSVAPLGSQMGDSLMQQQKAFVFAEDNFVALGATCKSGFPKRSWFDSESYYMGMGEKTVSYVPLADLSKDMAASHNLYEPSELTSKENLVIATLNRAGNGLVMAIWPDLSWREVDNKTRAYRVGASDIAHGWTDGESYIAINRNYIAQLSLEADGMAKLGALMIHEYCHGAPSSNTHIHSPEFYRNFHDATIHGLDVFVSAAMQALIGELRSTQKRMTKAQALIVARDEEARDLTVAVGVATAPSAEPDGTEGPALGQLELVTAASL